MPPAAAVIRSLLLPAVLLVLAGCTEGRVQGTSARVRVPGSVVFPKTWVGETARASLLVEASGTSPVQVSSIGIDSPEIQLENASATTIAGGTSTTVVLIWQPKAAGTLTATLHVETDVEDARELTVPVLGTSAVPPDCDDGDQCTDDLFDRASEKCVHRPHERACDDGNACTTDDRCFQGACRGRALSCDDGDVCTLNLCDPTKGCVFPPDGRTCDDGDPCTKDVCDNVKGCSHPDADSGTSCGSFSCAEAHVCVFGKCRALDVTGASDGLPCFDGDLCTENDTCEAGQCVGGPRLQAAPTVLKTFDTFGAAGDFVASDGFRFLFAEPRRVRIATQNAAGELELRGSLTMHSTVPPALDVPGRFLTAAASAITLVDANNPDHPAVVWTATLAPAFDGTAREIVRLWANAGSLVVWARRATGIDELLSVPLGTAPTVLGSPQLLFAAPAFLDADCAGNRAAVTTATGARALTIEPSGHPTDVVDLVNVTRPGAVSVLGDQVAVVSGDRVQLHLVTPQPHQPTPCVEEDPACREIGPGCDGTFSEPVGIYRTCDDQNPCPAGSECRTVAADPCPSCDRDCRDACCDHPIGICFASASPEDTTVGVSIGVPVYDLALTDAGLFASLPTGVRVLQPPLAGSPLLDAHEVSELPARNLAWAPGMLLTWGTIAQPFAIDASGPVPTLSALIGKGLGEAVAAANGSSGKMLVAGPHAVGSIDLVGQAIASWSVIPRPSSETTPRVLFGNGSAAAIDLFAGVNPAPFSPSCYGVHLETVDETLAVHDEVVCGLQNASLDVRGLRLVSDGDASGDVRNAPTPRRVDTYDLSGTDPTAIAAADDSIYTSDVRICADGGVLLYSQEQGGLHVRQLSESRPTAEVDYTFDFAVPEPRKRWYVAADGNAWLTAYGQDLALYAVDPSASLALRSTRHEGEPVWFAVATMENGRAWAAARRSDGSGWLFQLGYDAVTPVTLDDWGRVELPEAAERMFDAGAVTVATSPHAITFVRPACR